jgi:hypothetical protein
MTHDNSFKLFVNIFQSVFLLVAHLKKAVKPCLKLHLQIKIYIHFSL